MVFNTDTVPNVDPNLYGPKDRDQYFSTSLGVLGVSLVKIVNNKVTVRAGAAVSHQSVISNHDYIFRFLDANGKYVVDSLVRMLDYNFRENKAHGYFSFSRYLDPTEHRHYFQAGINMDYYFLNYRDSARQLVSQPAPGLEPWRVRWNTQANIPLIQPYIQYKYHISERLTLLTGLTSLYWGVNNSSFSPIEPRLALNFSRLREERRGDVTIKSGHSASVSVSLHSQIQPAYLYFYGVENVGNDPQELNRDLGLNKSVHFILGDRWRFNNHLSLITEVYFQHLYNLPVAVVPSSYSLVNAGTGFNRLFPPELQSTGIGRNMGAEMSLSRALSKKDGFFYTLSGTIFESTYRGNDEIWRSTSFDSRYVFRAIGGKGFDIGRLNSQLVIGSSFSIAGGRWYGPVDSAASSIQQSIVFVDEEVNTLRFEPYMRFDFKINYRLNRDKVSHEFALDLVNVLNRQNPLGLVYDPEATRGTNFEIVPQLAFLPIFYYKINL